MNDTDDEVAALRAEVRALRADVAALRQPLDAPVAAAAPAQDVAPTRRGLLRLAGAAVVGAGAAVVAASPAAADNGITTTNGAATTTLASSASTGFHFKASDSTYTTNAEVILASAGPTQRHAIRAFSNNGTATVFVRNDTGAAMLVASQNNGSGVTIVNSVGPDLCLSGNGLYKNPPGTRSGQTHFAGALDVDVHKDLWYCHSDSFGSSPGQWRKLAGPGVAGAFHAINPIRVYDSRRAAYTPNGLRPRLTSFVVPVHDARDTNTGAVVTADVVPVGATAVSFNVTAVGTTGANFLAVTPGDAATNSASTLNWWAAGQSIANSSISTLDALRQVKVFMGSGAGSAHVIIDIQGYWM